MIGRRATPRSTRTRRRRRTNTQPGDANFDIAVDFSLQNIYSHGFADAAPRAVEPRQGGKRRKPAARLALGRKLHVSVGVGRGEAAPDLQEGGERVVGG